MALKHCKECGKEVSSRANKCPHCGAPQHTHPVTKLIAILLGLLVVGAIFSALFDNVVHSPSKPSVARVPASPQPTPATGPDAWKSNPANACAFLTGHGFDLGRYKSDGAGYFCSVPAKEYGRGAPMRGVIPNNITYYVTGSKNRIDSIRLTLNVNSASEAEETTEVFNRLADALVQKTTGSSLSAEQRLTLGAGVTTQWDLEGASASVKRNDWPTGKGYDIVFTLK